MVVPVSLRKKIFLGILAALILGLGALAIWWHDEIGMVINGLRYSPEELEQRLEENEQVIRDATQIVPDVPIREITEEDRQALKDGTITTDELVQSLVVPIQKPEQDTAVDAPQQPEQGGAQQPEPEPQTPQVTDYQKQLASILAEVYVLREEFLIKLDNLLAQAKAEYLALAPEDRGGTALANLAAKYFPLANSLELECDARMREIIGRMETLLEENGGDLSIAQAVMDAYLEEKSLKKSWYLAELKKRGI